MRILLSLTAYAVSLQAGMIRGVVLENRSGRPLTRASVHAGVYTTSGVKFVRTVTSDRSGGFLIEQLDPGQYVIGAERRMFALTYYGQKRDRGPGTLISVTGDTDFFAEIRLKRLPAITGSVYDENRIGLPDHPVVVYPDKPPYRVLASAKTDDRGVYRVAGLPTGRYLVRSGAYEFSGGEASVPTFHPSSVPVQEAKVISVELDGEYPDADIYPVPGKASRLSGKVTCTPRPGEQINSIDVTLSSDTGNRKQSTVCDGAFSFDGLAPGDYELLGEADWPKPVAPGGPIAAFQSIYVSRDMEGVSLNLTAPPQVSFNSEMRLIARRKDLSGFREPVELVTAQGKPVSFTPGFWEVRVLPPPGKYLRSLESRFSWRIRSKAGASEDWLDVQFTNRGFYPISADFSDRVASLEGQVSDGTSHGAYAPVVLYPKDSNLRQRMGGYRTVYASNQGKYRLADLPPGEYFAGSSWDLDEVTAESLQTIGAKLITLKEGESAVLDLELYRAP